MRWIPHWTDPIIFFFNIWIHCWIKRQSISTRTFTTQPVAAELEMSNYIDLTLYYLRFKTHAMMVHFTTVYLTSLLPYFLVWIPGSKLHLAQVLVCVLLSSQNENKPVTWPSESFIINSFLDCWKRKWKLIWQFNSEKGKTNH